MGAFGRAATYALGVGSDRQGEKQSRCGGDNLDLHAISPELVLSTHAPAAALAAGALCRSAEERSGRWRVYSDLQSQNPIRPIHLLRIV
jgi:hypothetical protein